MDGFGGYTSACQILGRACISMYVKHVIQSEKKEIWTHRGRIGGQISACLDTPTSHRKYYLEQLHSLHALACYQCRETFSPCIMISRRGMKSVFPMETYVRLKEENSMETRPIILAPRNPSFDELFVGLKCQSTDFEALKL